MFKSTSTRSYVLLAIAMAITTAIAQDQPPLKTCQKIRRALLGFDYVTKKPVWDSVCKGQCLSVISKPSTCQPSYIWKKVHVAPLWLTSNTYTRQLTGIKYIPYKTRWVRYVHKCICKPKQCSYNGRTYNNGARIYNQCNDLCTCSYGKLVNCCRRRKSIMHMSTTERVRYMNALHDASTGTGAGTVAIKGQYDALIQDHADHFSAGIHHPDELLPWHRNFIRLYEDVLRQIDCRVTVPYWAWELDAASPWTSTLWNPSTNWFGGGTGGGCVPDGRWTLPWVTTPSNGNNCLRRSRSGGVPTPAQVAALLAWPAASFGSFASQIDGMHGGVHCSISGTMCTLGSANAPEFFLHHGNMDRLWAKWQKQSPAHQSAYGPALNTPMTPASLAGGYTPKEMLDIGHHPDNSDGICVTYVEPRRFITGVLANVPRSLLLATPAPPLSYHVQAYHWFNTVMKGNMHYDAVNATLEEFRGSPEGHMPNEASVALGLDVPELMSMLHDLMSSPKALKIAELRVRDVEDMLRRLREYTGAECSD